MYRTLSVTRLRFAIGRLPTILSTTRRRSTDMGTAVGCWVGWGPLGGGGGGGGGWEGVRRKTLGSVSMSRRIIPLRRAITDAPYRYLAGFLRITAIRSSGRLPVR